MFSAKDRILIPGSEPVYEHTIPEIVVHPGRAEGEQAPPGVCGAAHHEANCSTCVQFMYAATSKLRISNRRQTWRGVRVVGHIYCVEVMLVVYAEGEWVGGRLAVGRILMYV